WHPDRILTAQPFQRTQAIQDVPMRPNVLVALLVGALLAAGPGNDAAKKDLEKFQGTWQLISAERDGKKSPDKEAKNFKLSIQGDKFILRMDSVIISEGTMTLDPTKRPKEVDETITN